MKPHLKCVKNYKTISKSVCLENRIELACLSEIIMLNILWGSKFLSLLSFQRIFIRLDVSYASQHTFSKVTVTVTFENVCWLAYETSSLIKMRWNTMFITAVCVIFLIKLRWPKNKSLYDCCLCFPRFSWTVCPLGLTFGLTEWQRKVRLIAGYVLTSASSCRNLMGNALFCTAISSRKRYTGIPSWKTGHAYSVIGRMQLR